LVEPLSIRARRALEKAVSPIAQDASPGLVLGVVDASGLLAFRASGLASLEHGVPVTESTVFYLASVSKQFTAACVLMAEDSGWLTRSDSLRQYVPELPAWADEVKIAHLMSHSAGLPDYGQLVNESGQSMDAPMTDEVILALLARQRDLRYAPGLRCEYSNTAFWLLGIVVGRAAGESLRSLADELLFERLGMGHTWYRDDRWEVIPNLAEGYLPLDGDGYGRWRTCFDRVGDGGVVSSMSDLARYEAEVLSSGSSWATLAARLAEPVPLLDGSVSECRAGVLVGNRAGHSIVMAGGTGAGYRAFSVRHEAAGATVVALSNLGSADVRSPAFAVLDELLSR